MYCPHCGTELPEDLLIWDELEREKWTKDFTCPNGECGTILSIVDAQATSQVGRTEVIME